MQKQSRQYKKFITHTPLYLFLIVVTLPLFVGGCKEKHEGLNGKLDLYSNEGIVYDKFSRTPYTGKSYILFNNNQKEQQGTYKDGKLHGIWFTWNQKGQKIQEASFRDGEFNGVQKKWYENGQQMLESNWRNGERDGLYRSWHRNGRQATEQSWKEDRVVPNSTKLWNGNGRPVDTIQEVGL